MMNFKNWFESFQGMPMMYHGSPSRKSTLQPGTMLTVDPIWAAGYTTKISNNFDETFTGVVHAAKIQSENDYLISGSLHDAESFLIDYARKYGIIGKSLYDLAKGVHEKTEWDALTASFRGTIVGAINLVEIPVLDVLDPVEVLKAKYPNIPDNLKQALEKNKLI